MKTISLTKGKSCLVDEEDYDFLIKFSWSVNSSGYARTRVKNGTGELSGKYIYMHRLIMKASKGDVVDHIDGNKLNNRKVNMRICKQSDNVKNSSKISNGKTTSKYKGVRKRGERYQANIINDKKLICIGSFSSELAAANAYNFYAIKLFGVFAKTNDCDYMSELEWMQYKTNNRTV